MIFTPKITAIVSAIVFGAVLLQLSFFSLTPLLGSVANIVPVVIASLGLLGGAVPGAVAGFFAGLLLDSALDGTLGVSSLALLSAGYLAGRWRENFDVVSGYVPPVVAGALCGVSAIVFIVFELMLGVEAPVSLLAAREVLVQTFLGGLFAIGIFPLVRKLLRPALVEDVRSTRPTKRRRRPGMVGSTG